MPQSKKVPGFHFEPGLPGGVVQIFHDNAFGIRQSAAIADDSLIERDGVGPVRRSFGQVNVLAVRLQLGDQLLADATALSVGQRRHVFAFVFSYIPDIRLGIAVLPLVVLGLVGQVIGKAADPLDMAPDASTNAYRPLNGPLGIDNSQRSVFMGTPSHTRS